MYLSMAMSIKFVQSFDKLYFVFFIFFNINNLTLLVMGEILMAYEMEKVRNINIVTIEY